MIVEELIADASHTVTGLSFSYRYVSGYGPAGREVRSEGALRTDRSKMGNVKSDSVSESIGGIKVDRKLFRCTLDH